MRIIAGRFRRRKLLANPGLTTRPITDRAKEVLFERLAGDVVGKRIADIFAGTGTIGLEALSRGAESVVFIERDHKAFELLKQNVATLEVEDDTLCWRCDVLRSSFRPQNAEEFFPYDTIFFDPPYKMVDDITPGKPLYRSLKRLLREDVSNNNALLVLRAPQFAEFELPDGWEFDRTLDLKSMCVHLFDKRPEGNTVS